MGARHAPDMLAAVVIDRPAVSVEEPAGVPRLPFHRRRGGERTGFPVTAFVPAADIRAQFHAGSAAPRQAPVPSPLPSRAGTGGGEPGGRGIAKISSTTQ